MNEQKQHIIREATKDCYGVVAERRGQMWYISRFHRAANPVAVAVAMREAIQNIDLPETARGKAYTIKGQPRGIAAGTYDLSELKKRFGEW